MRGRRATLTVAAVLAAALAACSGQTRQASPPPVGFVEASSSASPSLSPSALPSPSLKPSPSRSPSPKPTKKKVSTKTVPPVAEKPPVKPATGDGVPTKGSGTFAIAGGSTGVVGTGTTLVKYRVEVEKGIDWGNHVWTVDEFAGAVDGILAGEQGWTMSGEHPVTDAAEQMTDASWSFQRVADSSYGVRIRLATPDTVDKLCGSAGVNTEGVYSCRYGKNIMINLRRWLKGATGFTNMAFYRSMVINHEMGHFLGFNHMKCPGSGKLAPVMQTQTIALNGCKPNDKPFTAEGVFVLGPWAPS